MKIGQVFNPHQTFIGLFIPNCLVRHKGISATAKLCWGRLAQYAGGNSEAYPSQKTLAGEIGITRSQIIRVLAMLEEQGFIKRLTPKGNDKWLHKTTRYTFLWHEIFEGRPLKVVKSKGVKSKGIKSNIFEEARFKAGERGNFDDPQADIVEL